MSVPELRTPGETGPSVHAPRGSSGRRRGTARGGVLLTVLLLIASFFVPASAYGLGEDGDFDLPLATTQLSVSATGATHIPLTSILRAQDLGELDLESLQYEIPPEYADEDNPPLAPSDDGHSLAVGDQGTWTIEGTDLVFSPDTDLTEDPLPIGISIASVHGTRSHTATLPVIAVEHSDATIAASAGETVQLAVPGSTQPAVADVRLQLDDLPDGSTLTSDGHTVVVPDEGTWTVSADLASLRFDPESSNLSNEPSPVQFSVLGDDGTLLRTATASVTTPVLPSMVRAAPYGDKIVMDLTDTSENVENSTLRLVPVTDVGITEVGSMGTWVEVAGQGRWELDRDEETVTFTPESADVRAASPVGITGNDQNGHTSAVALLRAGYPAVVPQRVGGAAGSAVSFTPMNPSRDARTGSLGFVPINDQDDMPEGATISGDGNTLVVPGSGTWSIGDQGTVTFDPESEFDLGTENSIKVSVQGAYANNRTTTTLTALTSDPPATARDDHLVTETGTQTRTDLLANDTAGAPSRPLQAATVRLRSVDAGNLDDLEEWSGTRLVLPEQGEFVVSSDGVLTFTPVPGFVGTTTAVQYDVADSAGVPTTASVTVDVNPTGTATDQEDTDAAGINSMLHGVLDSRRPGASAFGAIALALGLAGVASVWIGARMEADRRTWLD